MDSWVLVPDDKSLVLDMRKRFAACPAGPAADLSTQSHSLEASCKKSTCFKDSDTILAFQAHSRKHIWS